MKKLCLLLLSLSPLCFGACTLPREAIKYVEVPYEVVRTEYATKIAYDSIYIYEKEFQKNDTIYLQKIEYKYKLRCDTIRDSIPYPMPTPYEVKVDNPIPFVPKMYRVLSAIGVLALLLAILKLIKIKI